MGTSQGSPAVQQCVATVAARLRPGLKLEAAAKAAGQRIEQDFRDFQEHGNLPETIKKDGTLQFETDQIAEEILRQAILEDFPQDAVWGEEGGLFYKEDLSRLWVIDGLDGSSNFKTGISVLACQAAYLVDGVLVAAIIFLPFTNECFTAVKGKGACRNGRPITVAAQAIKEGNVMTFFSRSSSRRSINAHREIYQRITDFVKPVRILGSAAVSAARVACGGAHAAIYNSTRPYDVLPGALVVKEAGGCVTDFQGNDLTFEQPLTGEDVDTFFAQALDVVLCAQTVHKVFLQALA